MTSAGSPGFFGKLPSRGDFVTRRLSTDFVSRWDAWLQSALAASQAALGSHWLDVYLTSPMWRFAVSPGVCDREAHLGVVIPSVDKVGRYFPLTAAAPCGRGGAALALAFELDSWYSAIENLLLATLAETPLELDAFDERLSRLVVTGGLAVSGGEAWSRPMSPCDAHMHWHCTVPAADSIRDAMPPLLSEALAGGIGRYGVWWTQGSERVAPCALIASELPDPEACIAMLDGCFTEHGWASGTLHREERREERRTMDARSAAVTDTGKVRKVNEDSCACRDDLSVWIVADGLGGHQAGDTASRMVASVIGQLAEAPDLSERVEQLVRALRVVNGCLRVLAQRDVAAGLAGSTVAALLIEGTSAACVWAGDSRIYRFRNGELQQLSRDHSDAEGGSTANHAVTRAVGGDDALDLEIECTENRAGDRYLLCSDGLYGELTNDEIISALSRAEPQGACSELKQAVLKGEARDNLTAVVVHVLDMSDVTA
jgi:type VI secretion system protein ImpM